MAVMTAAAAATAAEGFRARPAAAGRWRWVYGGSLELEKFLEREGLIRPVARRQREQADEGWPWTPFQAWLDAALERRGGSLKDMAKATGADYTHVWKLARGNPARYPRHQRPGYEVTVAIGEYVGDVEGAVKAAGYPSGQNARPDRREIALPRGYSLNAPASDPNADRLSALFAQMLEMIEAGQTVEAGVASPERQAAAEDAVREFYGPAGLPENFPGTPAAPPPADAQEGDGEPGKG